MWTTRCCAALGVGLLVAVALADDSKPADSKPGETRLKVSYYQQIRPIFQASCQGCHQPAKAGGSYVMTSLAALIKGGDSGAAVVRRNPDESNLLTLITPSAGKADMPKDRPPLAASEIELVRRWIQEGAVDDTPSNAQTKFDAKHPPQYTRPPVIVALDFAPQGELLAVAGFHEVLLWKADGAQRVARLIGMAERIESVRFSPDGTRLAAVGGNPCRMGEVQVWDVAGAKLLQSLPMTCDTLYGGSWSPDGKLIALGAADNVVRAVEVASGKQVLSMAAHQDWVRGTAFTGDGKSICSASRDMTVKMAEVSSSRFLGNVTTHTPGVLRGGMMCVQRHPKRDEILVGSADGAPKLFRMDVKAAPASGGNPNQIREFEALPGRVFAVAFSPDGSRAYAVSSLDGHGEARCFETETGKVLWKRAIAESGLYALAASADGKSLATAGADGRIRLLDPADGTLRKSFLPVELTTAVAAGATTIPHEEPTPAAGPTSAAAAADAVPDITRIEVEPAIVRCARRTDYTQILLTATLADGTTQDVTRLAQWKVSGDLGWVSSAGRFTPGKGGTGQITATVAGKKPQAIAIPVALEGWGWQNTYPPDYVRDVNPVLARLGCNAGTCHGAAKGKNGFKLSLRGYDPVFDLRALTDDLASRRVNTASPDDSLMLLKATGAVPHQGGQLIRPDSAYYALLREWIAAGAALNTQSPRAAKIDILPHNPIVQQVGGSQQMRVVATYADGSTRDVTGEAFIESGNSEVLTGDRTGLMTAVRRGEASVLARYDGSYTATLLTVMGQRGDFVWQQPETWGRVDELVAAKWQRMKILPSPLAGDADFLRRVDLDLTGLPPTADEVRAFLADPRATRVKRDAVIDRLIGSDDYLDHWANKWADLLQVNRKYLGPEGAAAYRQWIRDELAANTPYDVFARNILTASGSNRQAPAASYFKVLRDPRDIMENTTHLFLAVRFNCNKCHDHPFERWTQDQYYQTAAFFARVDLKSDPASGGRVIGGTAVDGAKPLYEIVGDKRDGEVLHDRTQAVTPPKFPYATRFECPKVATRRQEFTAWLTAPDNAYFARSYVNRLWGYLLGVGLIEPLDDIRAGNPPSNPELLEYLTTEFIRSKFDVRHMQRLICKSRTYQLSIETSRWNDDDRINYAHAIARRLPAEVLYDAIHRVTGTPSDIPGVPKGTRAEALPDAGVNLADGFLNSLGRPARESACECERTNGMQLGSVMALISGPTVERAISDPANELARLAGRESDPARLAAEIFLRVLNRPATPAEIESALALWKTLPEEDRQLTRKLADREKQQAPAIQKQEQERNAAIAKAARELAAYEKQIAPREAQLDQQQRERVAKAEAALKQSEGELPVRLAQWEKQASKSVVWTPLDPSELTATGNVKLTRQPDLSIYAEGPEGKVEYKVTARTDVAKITGVMLEALADDRLPARGPGRSPNGNFVLSRFRVQWASQKRPEKRQPVALARAQADFAQRDFTPDLAIAAKKGDRNKGWAIVPKSGENHKAVFETQQDTPAEPGQFTFILDHQFNDGRHALGRFRISITTAPRPLVLDGVPQDVAAILAVAAEKRTDKQKTILLAFYSNLDQELSNRRRGLFEAQKPRPIDPQLQALRSAQEAAQQPIALDPQLIQLRRAAQLSKNQLTQARQTFAQDLAWALINSPAFLFNR